MKLNEDSDIITFVHLSDFHFHRHLQPDHERVFELLLEDLAKLSKDYDLRPDFIVLSGDVAFSGKDKEYNVSQLHLDDLRKEINVPKDRLIVVPGNHDVDRKKTNDVLKFNVQSEQDVTNLFRNKQHIRFLCQKFRGFKLFLDRFLEVSNHKFRYDHPFYNRVLDVRGRRIGIAALNSAFLSQKDTEYGKLVLGEFQVQTAVKELQALGDRHLNIAVFHHPLSYLAKFDFDAVTPLLMRDFDLILTGHLHGAESWRIENPDGSIQTLVAGSEFDNRTWYNSYGVVRLNLSERDGMVFLRRWNNEGGGRWSAYVGRFDKQNELGAFDFKLARKEPLIPGKAESLPHFPPEHRILQKFPSLLEVERENLTRDAGYVPLHFSPSFRLKESQKHDLEKYLDDWLEDKMETETFLFLLGDYGTGKSRYLQHYTGVLARRFLRNPGTARIPILLILNKRHFLGSLEKLTVSTLIEKYGLHISFEEIKQLMKSGRVVMLLDGFDELAPNTTSHVIYESLKELAAINYPGNKIIIAGRSGYILANPELRRILAKESLDTRDYYHPTGLLTDAHSDISGIRALYLQKLDDRQMQQFIDRYPNAIETQKELARQTLKKNEVLNEMARRPVVLKLILDCQIEAIANANLKRVSDFYKLVTEEWISRELDRLGIPDNTEQRKEGADFISKVIETLASHRFYTGKVDISMDEALQLAMSVEGKVSLKMTSSSIVNILPGYIFLETTLDGRLSFKHRSFHEFHVARHILRTIKEGAMPDFGDKLPSIEILDYLRELFDDEALDKSLHILDHCSPSANLKIILLIALRQFPEVSRSRFFKYAANPEESFGVRRVATMSSAQYNEDCVHQFIKFHTGNRQAQYENIAFLKDLWKADPAEIRRRTRFRLENLDNPDRPYWKIGRGIHIATLGQVGSGDDISLLEKYLTDPDPVVSQCAKEAVQNIKLKISPEAKALDDRLELALAAVKEAGKILMKRFGQVNPILHADPHDVTTEADEEAQEVICDLIQRKFPGDDILAEEKKNSDFIRSPKTAYRWIIDPLDGTVNFVAGLERFSVAIAIEHEGKAAASVIYAPISDDIYWAHHRQGAFHGECPIKVSSPSADHKPLVAYATSRHRELDMSILGGKLFKEITSRFRSMRLSGCASLDFCDLACGRFDALVKLPGFHWDFIPGIFLVQEARGKIEQFSHPSNSDNKYVIAGSCDKVTGELSDILKELLENN